MEKLVEEVKVGDVVVGQLGAYVVVTVRHSRHYGRPYTTLFFELDKGIPGQMTHTTFVPNGEVVLVQ